SHRQLIPLPHGVTVIDTPGMREIQLWDVSGGISTAFEDIEALAAGCRFSDCSHLHEPGCAVKEAVKDGTLPNARLESYEKQIRELASLEARRDKRLARENARRGGKVGKEAKEAKNRARHQER
ncbi:MAG TPA: ribosome small subunit-dependent GTPase, partial [Actinomycetota bacterium]|nr:ribosome small subunit-dependent GTPase [Actinomycetota bacterium]